MCGVGGVEHALSCGDDDRRAAVVDVGRVQE
jgi:hypothetical protein